MKEASGINYGKLAVRTNLQIEYSGSRTCLLRFTLEDHSYPASTDSLGDPAVQTFDRQVSRQVNRQIPSWLMGHSTERSIGYLTGLLLDH